MARNWGQLPTNSQKDTEDVNPKTHKEFNSAATIQMNLEADAASVESLLQHCEIF